MTASKKVLIAATLLAAGYGVAAFLGAPRPSLSAGGPSTPATGSLPLTSASDSAPAGDAAPLVGGVRLLPDPARPDAVDGTGAKRDAALKVPSVLEFSNTPQTLSPPVTCGDAPELPLVSLRSAPRARLRDESPRPLPDASRQDVEARPTLPDVPRADAPIQEPSTSPAARGEAQPAGLVPIPRAVAAPAIYQPLTPLAESPQPAAATFVGPPPWPIDDPVETRTHVVIDGDTLSKLAGRYLGDPQRSDEIFALNRNVLSDPQLLPIGVELQLPPRRRGRESGGVDAGKLPREWKLSESQSLRTADPGGLVPVQPPELNPAAMPRAQIMPPQPVD